jgi:hypothetical protein
MKKVFYKGIIKIDGQHYVVVSRDYSESIDELICDEVIEPDSQSIIDYVIDDIVNSN